MILPRLMDFYDLSPPCPLTSCRHSLHPLDPLLTLQNEGRNLFILWIQDLPRYGQAVCPQRQQSEYKDLIPPAIDTQVFRFVNSKSESLFQQRKNPRKIAWTVVYRRMHKKGITEEVAKKRSRRTVKHQRAVVGASMDAIRAKRNMKPEARAAARAAAIRDGKEKKKAEEAKRKSEKAKTATSTARGQPKISKQQAKGAKKTVDARSR